MDKPTEQKKRAARLVKVYPLVLILLGTALNIFVFGIDPLVVALPSPETIVALTISAVLLLGNHTWLMTTTELTRVRFGMATTPEEWATKDMDRTEIPQTALDELERRHNAHRNTTENVIYFIFLALIFALASPPALAVQIWLIGFGAARLGYTYSYLTRNTGARGLFMSLSLLALYGLASYLALAAIA